MRNMTRKRRNAGRAKVGRGHVRAVMCGNCVRCVPKYKAIKRFVVRNIVDASAFSDNVEASIHISFQLPKQYAKDNCCVSGSIKKRNRSKKDRRIPTPPKSTFPRNKYTLTICPECVQNMQRRCSN